MRLPVESIMWEDQFLRLSNVHAEVTDLGGDRVLRVERDLTALPFEISNLASTVDEATFVELPDFSMSDGILEVKMLSRIQRPSPFAQARGFIGLAFHIVEDRRQFEAIYLRPNLGQSRDQAARNHAVQYFAYPDYKFQRLRAEEPGRYETWADIALDEWITVRVEVNGPEAVLYLNDHPRPAFVVNPRLGLAEKGTVGIFVDVGTIGYFKDLRITNFS